VWGVLQCNGPCRATTAEIRARKAVSDLHRCTFRWIVISLVGAFACSYVGADRSFDVRIMRLDVTSFPTVKCYVSVVDENGHSVNGLVANNWVLTEDAQVQQGLRCAPAREDDQRLAVVLLVDTSGSMRGEPLTQARKAVASFISRLSAHDYCAVVGFSTQTKKLGELEGYRGEELSFDLSDLQARGNTALYEAIAEGVVILQSREADRKAVLVLTDGQDNVSKISDTEATERVLGAGASLYAIGLGKDADAPVLTRMAEATKGLYQPIAKASELVDAYRSMLEDIRTYYMLSYETVDRHHGEPLRVVQVSLKSAPAARADAQYLVPLADGVDLHETFGGDSESWLLPVVIALLPINLLLLILVVRRRQRQRHM
jgi:VWFA-related protein